FQRLADEARLAAARKNRSGECRLRPPAARALRATRRDEAADGSTARALPIFGHDESVERDPHARRRTGEAQRFAGGSQQVGSVRPARAIGGNAGGRAWLHRTSARRREGCRAIDGAVAPLRTANSPATA